MRLLLFRRGKAHGQRQASLCRCAESLNRFFGTGQFRRKVGQGLLVHPDVGFHFGREELDQRVLDLLSLVVGQRVFARLRQEDVSQGSGAIENVNGTARMALDKVSVDSQNIDVARYNSLQRGLDDRQ